MYYQRLEEIEDQLPSGAPPPRPLFTADWQQSQGPEPRSAQLDDTYLASFKRVKLITKKIRYTYDNSNGALHRRGPWSQGEDDYLIQLVHTQGALNWIRIAQLMGARLPKQCRERYHQNLAPTLNHAPISPEEGLGIERLVAEMGKRWAEIARRLNGRSDKAVKSWWNGSMNRR